MKNKFKDLNDHRCAQLERLSEEGLTEEQLLTEVTRSQAMVAVSSQIVGAAALQLKAVALVAEHGGRFQAPANLIEHMPETAPATALKTVKG